MAAAKSSRNGPYLIRCYRPISGPSYYRCSHVPADILVRRCRPLLLVKTHMTPIAEAMSALFRER